MTNDQLAEYLPSFDDRLAVFGHCRLKGKEPSGHKAKLFEQLRGRLSRRKGDCESVSERTSNPSKECSNVFVRVRTKKVGGTRKESV